MNQNKTTLLKQLESECRTIKVTFRLTWKEYEQLEKLAGGRGKVSEFIREKLGEFVHENLGMDIKSGKREIK